MVKLLLVAEFESAGTEEEARARLDGFRESIQPSSEYGITLYETFGVSEVDLIHAFLARDDEGMSTREIMDEIRKILVR